MKLLPSLVLCMAVFIASLMFGTWLVTHSKAAEPARSVIRSPYQPNRIVKQITDDRGLTSVVYSQDGHEWALDYLSTGEYNSLVNVLNNHK